MTAPFSITALDQVAMIAAADRWSTRAKPPGSLGRLEALAVRLAGITGTCPPAAPTRPAVVVFAGDHGVVSDGASAWPSVVTKAMVVAMAEGGAAVSAFAATVGATVEVVDVGVDGDIEAEGVVIDKVRRGTASLAHGPAMTVDEVQAALEVGTRAARRRIDAGADLLVAGDMGIGNTTPAACLIAARCGAAAAKVVGAGAGLPEAQLPHKVALVEAGLARVDATTPPVDLLAEVGGCELAAMAGFYVESARSGIPVVVDGVIALAALLAADALAPGVAARCIAGHRSVEPGASVALAHLGMEPLLDLDLRLGEGTGAVLAIPLVQAAARALGDMADLPTGP
jgi:nicotinate-nucleotide--dimethylbenzimidazole phosphoribosyltransferase